MKIADIKNRDQLMEIGDIWYQRAKNIMEYFRNESKPTDKRVKAFELALVLQSRISQILIINTKLDAKIISNIKFEVGGIVL